MVRGPNLFKYLPIRLRIFNCWANPDKFQTIAIGPKTNKHNLSFDLKGNKITCEENVNLLGITIDSQLNLDKHILENCEKASQQLNIKS
jgi:hypothetical protein